MNLLSRARQLIASGNLATASAIAIMPLATAVSDASITFGISEQAETSIFRLGSDSSLDTYTKLVQSGGSTYTFNLQLGDGTQTDSDIFSSVSNSYRYGSFYLSGSCTGTIASDEYAVLTYKVTTTLSDGTTTVSYKTYSADICDSTGKCLWVSGGSTSTQTSSGSTSDVLDTIYITDTTTYGNSSWDFLLGYDWDIEDVVGTSSYSSSQILEIVVEGSLTVVPEPSSWGLLGASATLGAAAMLRRRKNALPSAGA